MSFAISTLLASLKTENVQDYVYACFFLISVRGTPLSGSAQWLRSMAPLNSSMLRDSRSP